MGCYDGSQYHWKGAGRELWHSGMISWGKIWAVRVDLSFLVAGLRPVTPPVPHMGPLTLPWLRESDSLRRHVRGHWTVSMRAARWGVKQKKNEKGLADLAKTVAY